jgi:outer membrane protein assembly factor BamB
VILHPLTRPRSAGLSLFFFFGAIACALVMSGCAPKQKAPPYSPPQPLTLQNFTRQWSVDVGEVHGAVKRVYVRDKYVFAYTSQGTSFMLDRNDGHIVAAHQIQHSALRLHAPVMLKDRIVYPTSSTLEIYDKSGNFLSTKNLHYSVRTEAVGSGNFLFYGADYAGGGRLVEVDISNPFLDHKWELMFPHASISSAPAVYGETVYAAGENGDVVAVSMENFGAVWNTPDSKFHSYGAVQADLVVDASNLYVASADQKLICLSRSNAKVKWQYIAGAALRDTPTVTKEMVFQFVPNAGLAALPKEGADFNRQPKWTAPEVTQFLAADDKYVYGQRQDHVIVALDKNTGQSMFTSRRTDYVAFAPNTEDGIIYAATSSGRVLAIKPVLTPGGMGEIVMRPVMAGVNPVALSQ